MYLSTERALALLKAVKHFGYLQPAVLNWLSRKKNLSFRTESMFQSRVRNGKFEISWAESVIEMVGKSDSIAAAKLRKEFLDV